MAEDLQATDFCIPFLGLNRTICSMVGDENDGDGFERGGVRGRAYSQRVHSWVGLDEAVAKRIGVERSIQSANRIRAATTLKHIFALSHTDIEHAKPLERLALLIILEPAACCTDANKKADHEASIDRVRLIAETAPEDDLQIIQLRLEREGKTALRELIERA